MFWKVPGFSQPSPVEQILDKQEFTLEELLDEDDIIQECKSLNGRLIAFLRERSTVEQLVRYLVEPQDSDDPKRTYKYPFTSCEVLCCELEAVYNTLLEDEELMKVLFSMLDSPAPLSCKTAGYFGRVVGNMLLRKNSEMLQYLQSQGTELLERLVRHVDTTSVADVIKRLVGADDQNSLMPPPAMAQWLAETPLIDLLLARLADSHSSEAQANAADILSATAHTQPSPLAGKLTQHASVATLVEHALAPGRQVLVSALDVCIALIEPRRAALGDMSGGMDAASNEAAQVAKKEAVAAIVQHLPRLVQLLSLSNSSNTQATPCGLLTPPLGCHRLKVVELLAVLVRSGCSAGEDAVMQCSAIPECLKLFAEFSFNNLLHHNVASMLVACMSSSSESMIRHLFEDCRVLDWIVGIPILVTPTPRPGDEEFAAAKAPLRAGYLGHITQIAGTLEGLAHGVLNGGMAEAGPSKIAGYTEAHEGWGRYLEEVLHPQQDLENTAKWACGRPAAQAIGSIDSDGDDFSHEMDLEQITGMQQPLYHRYRTDENEDDDGDDGEAGSDEFKTAFDFGTEMISEAISGMDINGMFLAADNSEDAFRVEEDADVDKQPDASSSTRRNDMGMDDDEVLLATSDEEFPLDASVPEPLHSVFPIVSSLSPGLGIRSPSGPGNVQVDAEDGSWQGQQEMSADTTPQGQSAASPQPEGAARPDSGSPVIDKTRVWQGPTWQVDVSDEV